MSSYPPVWMVARPMDLPVSFTDYATMPMTAPAPIRIELEDPIPHARFLEDLSEDLMRDNIKIEAVMFPVKAYYSLYAYIQTKGYGTYKGRGMEYFGIRILMNPRRDEGPPDLIFDDDNALKVLSRRKK